MKKHHKYIIAGVVGSVATVAACVVALPVVIACGSAGLLGAAGTGTIISTLSGAALTSASIAAAGGTSVIIGSAGAIVASASIGISAAVIKISNDSKISEELVVANPVIKDVKPIDKDIKLIIISAIPIENPVAMSANPVVKDVIKDTNPIVISANPIVMSANPIVNPIANHASKPIVNSVSHAKPWNKYDLYNIIPPKKRNIYG